MYNVPSKDIQDESDIDPFFKEFQFFGGENHKINLRQEILSGVKGSDKAQQEYQG